MFLVYLLEDDKNFGQLVQSRLNRFEDVKCDHFRDVFALEAAIDQQAVPQLILLDIDLTKTPSQQFQHAYGGIDVLKRLRLNKIHLPIFMFSSYFEDERVIKALEAGADGYITKLAMESEMEFKTAIDCIKEHRFPPTHSDVQRILDVYAKQWTSLREEHIELIYHRLFLNKTLPQIREETGISKHTLKSQWDRVATLFRFEGKENAKLEEEEANFFAGYPMSDLLRRYFPNMSVADLAELLTSRFTPRIKSENGVLNADASEPQAISIVITGYKNIESTPKLPEKPIDVFVDPFTFSFDSKRKHTYRGGENTLREYLFNAFEYPQIAKNANETGKFEVTFIVQHKGNVVSIDIQPKMPYALYQHIEKVIQNMGNWQRTDLYSRDEKSRILSAISVQYKMRIEFRIEETKQNRHR
ncbi:MAG TPA: response regulator [Rhodothermales bacterium]|nr:response regulator [Rhodothermales bacterium]